MILNSRLRLVTISVFTNTNGDKVIDVVNTATTIVNANLTPDGNSANAISTAYFTDENNSVALTNVSHSFQLQGMEPL